jgi:uncharacterized damage-inducible protein DinB
MDARKAIVGLLEMAEFVSMSYLQDLSDEELMLRPHASCNHVNWQIGHLVVSEHQLMNSLAPGRSPELPAGFAEKYARDTTQSNDATDFASKDELLAAYREQRAATLQLLEEATADSLDEPTGVEYAATKGAMFRLQGEHWLMHCGQWVVVRRACNKPVVI